MELDTSKSSDADVDVLPERPYAQTTALRHVGQILLCLSHVPVDGVHAFLNALQLLCWEQEFHGVGGSRDGDVMGQRQQSVLRSETSGLNDYRVFTEIKNNYPK